MSNVSQEEIAAFVNSLNPQARILVSKELLSRIEKDKAQVITTARKNLLAQIQAAGLTVDEVLPGVDVQSLLRPKKINKSINPPLYRNPNNSLETWTGRGNVPGWVKALDAKNVSRDTYLISELDKPYVHNLDEERGE